jgi:hypothetical protein
MRAMFLICVRFGTIVDIQLTATLYQIIASRAENQRRDCIPHRLFLVFGFQRGIIAFIHVWYLSALASMIATKQNKAQCAQENWSKSGA